VGQRGRLGMPVRRASSWAATNLADRKFESGGYSVHNGRVVASTNSGGHQKPETRSRNSAQEFSPEQ